jgi:two-component system chemotaxis response regulator CheY
MSERDHTFDGLTVLVVDDESFVRTMVKQMLRALGVTAIREADEGAAALKEIALFPPDLVICDLNMEPIDGLVFVQMLRSHSDHRLRDIPVIILSGKNDLGSVREATSKGINAYLVKPVSLQNLKARLDSVLSQPRYVAVDERRKIHKTHVGLPQAPVIEDP